MALMGFGDLDDMFGGVDRMMNNMMRNIFGSMPDPFDMMDNMLMGQGLGHYGIGRGMERLRSNIFNGPPYHSLMMSNIPNSSSYSYSSSVMTMSTDPHGRPQVYEATSSSRYGPGGVKETRSTVRDSASGLQQMSIGHHIDNRSHIMQRSRNNYTGEEEHNDEYINLEEEEATKFENEWQNRMHSNRSKVYNSSYQQAQIPQKQERLSLPAPSVSSTSSSSFSSSVHPPPISTQGYKYNPTSNRKTRISNDPSSSHSKGKMSYKHKSKRDKRPYEKN